MAFEIAKAGWLFRQSSVLRRWKKNWFVLYQDGYLRYFDSPEDHSAQEAFLLKTKCLTINSGLHLTGIEPPPAHGRSCLLQLNFTNTTLNLCAESPDDMNAWKLALEEARIVEASPSMMQTRPAYPGAYPYPYPGQTVVYHYPGHQPPPYVVNGAPGQTTVVYTQPQHYSRRYDGMDVATGVVAGAAVGSLMWGPLLWW